MVYFGDHTPTGFGLTGLPLLSLSALLSRQALSLRGKHYAVLDWPLQAARLLRRPCMSPNTLN